MNVVAKPGWILERFARELAGGLPGVRVNATGYPPNGPSKADLTYFLPMKDVRHMPGVKGIKVGCFTHGEERSREYVPKFDACVTMNRRMAEFLTGCGGRNVVCIRPGTEPPTRAPVFGVCGRVYGKGRKGAYLVAEAVEAGFQFAACSEPQNEAPPCRITHSIEQRKEFYRSIDYLVVTSLEEGGPMPVLEALANQVPVIAPDVGFCWELPVIRYERGSWRSLRAVLAALAQPPTWSQWVEGHRVLFERLVAA